MVSVMERSRLFEFLVVDGSFVTTKEDPNDIDVIAVLKAGHDFEREVSMADYALLSRTMLRRRYGFDVLVAESGSSLYDAYVDFFSRVREAPEVRKGLLELRL